MKENDDKITKKYDDSVLNQVLKIRNEEKSDVHEVELKSEKKPDKPENDSKSDEKSDEKSDKHEIDAKSHETSETEEKQDTDNKSETDEDKSSDDEVTEKSEHANDKTDSYSEAQDNKFEDAKPEEEKSEEEKTEEEKPKSKGVSRAYGKKKPRKKKKRRKKHYILKFAIAVAVIAGALVFMNDSMFDINEIAVEGNSKYSAEDIIKASGLSLNTNIFWAKAHKGEKELLKNPYFEEVEISREMPDKMTIKVKERVAFVSIKTKEKWVLLDENDVALEEKSDPGGVTPLYGMFIKEYKLGEKTEISGNEPYKDVKSLLKKSAKQNIRYKRVDVYKNYVLLYLSSKLYCKGTLENLTEAVDSGNMKTITVFCRKAHYKKGVVNIAGNGYVSIKGKRK